MKNPTLDMVLRNLRTELTKIEKEYDKPKKDRSKHRIKAYVMEAKSLKRMLKEAKRDHSIKCPHCGKVL